MSSNLSPCPKIDVIRWDSSQVTVKCPYCEELHRHSVRLPGNAFRTAPPVANISSYFPSMRIVDLSATRLTREEPVL